jgi:hypothetical protein
MNVENVSNVVFFTSLQNDNALWLYYDFTQKE